MDSLPAVRTAWDRKGRLQSLEQRLETGISTEADEVGIVLQPLAMTEAVGDRLVEARERLFRLVREGVYARDVVEYA